MLYKFTLDGVLTGLAVKIKAQTLFPSDKFMSVFRGLRQVNILRVFVEVME